MSDDLQAQVERLAVLSNQQSLCRHPVGLRSFVRNIATNEEDHLWWRCDECQINLLGPGYWVPHEYLLEQGIDVSDLEIVEDRRQRTPPCRVCGKSGAELHHWAPRHLFGPEADLWPTDYLCRSRRQRWHHLVEKIPLAIRQKLPMPVGRTSGVDVNEPRQTA